MITQALEQGSEPEARTATRLLLPAAAGMRRGTLVLCMPERRRADAPTSGVRISDADIEAFVAELRALGGMAVIA